MKKPISRAALLLIFCISLIASVSRAQSPVDFTIQVTTQVQANPPSVSFSWATVPASTGIDIYRKPKASMAWGTAIANLAGTAVNYTDNSVTVGTGYEYKLISKGGTSPSNYIYAGIEIPQTDQRGTVILIVDNTFTTTLAFEIGRLISDLTGDGWTVIRHNVLRTDAPPTVKALIKSDYTADPLNVKAVFVLGHVPVPYSGNIAPDGHPDHTGAWPTDSYYADMTGTWTDNTVNNTSGSRAENKNIPGDGKFDQNSIPSATLQIGRVDLSNMTAFFLNEQELLSQYLNKDHDFRNKEFNAQRKALFDDNWGNYAGENFSSSAWRAFNAMFPPSDIKTGDYITDMASQSYLWAWGGGAGSFSSCGGVASTSDLVNSTQQAVFTMLFGSYFGDWDNQDNILRAPLASSGWGLTSCWSGRPYFIFHHMALGENIGYSVLTTMLNSNTYPTGYFARYVDINLMGDPTLRMHIVAPPTRVTSAYAGIVTNISWTASTDAVLGYHVYRQDNGTGIYNRITTSAVTVTNYIDNSPAGSSDKYMVRAVLLETSNSGSYYNLSQGGFDDSDQTPPSVPINLVVSNILQDGFTLSWTASTDNVKMKGYDVYQDNILIGSTAATSFDVSNLTPSTTYAMKVIAYDWDKNYSTASNTLNVTTSPFMPIDTTGALLVWDFNGQGGKVKVPASTVMKGISTNAPDAVINTGPSFGPNNYFGGLSMANQNQTTLAGAISSNQYITLSVAPKAGNLISIDSVKIRPFTQNQLRNFTLMSSIAGFTDGNELGTITGVLLSGDILKTINVTGHNDIFQPIEFRIYIWGPNNIYETFGIGNGGANPEDDLMVFGNVKTLPTSIGQVSFKGHNNNVSIYPNPASEELFVELQEYKYANVELFKADGELVQKLSLRAAKNTLSISDLPVGFYWMTIQTSEGVSTRKIVKY
jgi:chitodextrinase